MNAEDLRRTDDTISELGVLERSAEPGLTALCRLVSYVTGADGAAVHILDSETQHRIAGANVPLVDHPREDSMCRLVVDGDERIVCSDASSDPRFSYSTFTQGPSPVRFYASVPLRMSDGTVIGSLCAFDNTTRELDGVQTGLLEDLAEQASAQIELSRVALELRYLASRDALTGAVNRRVLADRLAQASARQLRAGGQIVLAVVDIDRFKSVNDTLGHAAGDEILIAVAKRLSAVVRSQDTVARVGGDEFVVLAETDEDEWTAPRLVDRLIAAMADPFRVSGHDREVRASVGCAFAQPGDDLRAALARADAAMYARKAALA